MSKVTSSFLTVDGTRVHYLKCGHGPKLVFLHSIMTDAEFFQGLIEYLGQHFTVYAPDFPGFGKTEPLENPKDIKEMTTVLIKWAEKMDLDDFILSGVSMGGIGAVYFAEEIDHRIKAYILIAPFFGYRALKLPGTFRKRVAKIIYWVDRLIPRFLWKVIWKSTSLIGTFMKFFSAQNENKDLVNRVFSGKEKQDLVVRIKMLQEMDPKTLFHSLDIVLEGSLHYKYDLSDKPAILLMGTHEDTLDYYKTSRGFKKIFKKLRMVHINMKEHFPHEKIDQKYLDLHFPGLLRTIKKYIKY